MVNPRIRCGNIPDNVHQCFRLADRFVVMKNADPAQKYFYFCYPCLEFKTKNSEHFKNNILEIGRLDNATLKKIREEAKIHDESRRTTTATAGIKKQ